MAAKLKAWWLFAVALVFLAGVGFISFQNYLPTPDGTAWMLGILFGLASIAVFFLLSRARGEQAQGISPDQIREATSGMLPPGSPAQQSASREGLRFRRIMEAAQASIAFVSADGRIVEANDALLAMIGAQRNEIGELKWSQLFSPEQRHAALEYLRLHEGSSVEKELLGKDGTRIPVVLNAARLAEGQDEYVVLITHIREQEAALSPKRSIIWRAISESTLDLISVKDVEGRIIMANPAAIQALGTSESEIIGQTAFGLPLDSAHAAELVAGEQGILSSGQGKVVEETLEMPGGRRTFLSTKSPYFDGEGKIAGLSSISTDITERKRKEMERDAMLASEHQSRVEAENATLAKDEFLSLVAHELRSPLGAIRGWIHVLSNIRANETSRMRRALDGIKRNTELQAKLVDDLLDAAQIISGKLSLEKQPLCLKPLLEEAVEGFQPAAKAEGIELILACELQDEQVNGETARLSQVVRNLLSNAIKFSAEGGRIELTARRSGAHVQISVSDTGAGIAAEDITPIFDRFLRADLFAHRRRGGLGLGLAVVRRLVELQGGTVKAESAGEAKGATFTIELPLYDEPFTGTETRRFSAPAVDENWSYLDRPTELPTVPEKHSNHTSG